MEPWSNLVQESFLCIKGGLTIKGQWLQLSGRSPQLSMRKVQGTILRGSKFSISGAPVSYKPLVEDARNSTWDVLWHVLYNTELSKPSSPIPYPSTAPALRSGVRRRHHLHHHHHNHTFEKSRQHALPFAQTTKQGAYNRRLQGCTGSNWFPGLIGYRTWCLEHSKHILPLS